VPACGTVDDRARLGKLSRHLGKLKKKLNCATSETPSRVDFLRRATSACLWHVDLADSSSGLNISARGGLL
jgi:hypothetical protein